MEFINVFRLYASYVRNFKPIDAAESKSVTSAPLSLFHVHGNDRKQGCILDMRTGSQDTVFTSFSALRSIRHKGVGPKSLF